ncbi:MAG: hypothetical protein QM817_39360 [Archangium sp.]
MLITTLLVVLSQSAPPLVPNVGEPQETVPDEVGAFSEFVDRHLLSISLSEGGAQVRTRARAYRLVDEDFETAFALVPESVEMAHRAHEDAITSSHFHAAGMVMLGLSAGATLVASLLPAMIIPILVGSMVGLVISLVLTLIAIPLATNAQERFVNSVSTYNHGLLDLRSAAGQPSFGGMSVAF